MFCILVHCSWVQDPSNSGSWAFLAGSNHLRLRKEHWQKRTQKLKQLYIALSASLIRSSKSSILKDFRDPLPLLSVAATSKAIIKLRVFQPCFLPNPATIAALVSRECAGAAVVRDLAQVRMAGRWRKLHQESYEVMLAIQCISSNKLAFLDLRDLVSIDHSTVAALLHTLPFSADLKAGAA